MSTYPPNVFKVSLEEVDMLKTEQQTGQKATMAVEINAFQKRWNSGGCAARTDHPVVGGLNVSSSRST